MKKYFLFIIFFISSFMIYTKNVNAENSFSWGSLNNISYNTSSGSFSGYSTSDSNVNFSWKPTNSSSQVQFNFNNVTIPKYSNYFLISSIFINNSIDSSISCNNEYVTTDPLYDINFSTSYADGTSAQNSGDIQLYGSYRYCESFHYNNDDLAINITYRNGDNNLYTCPIVNSGNNIVAICPITYGDSDGSHSINQINFQYYFSNPNTDTFMFRFNRKLFFNLDSTQTILNAISNQTSSINSKLDELKQNQQATTQAVNQQTNTIKNENTSGAEGSADSLKNNSAFQDNTGLSGVISMPLTFVNSLTNTCQPINLTIPYMDVDLSIPCMQPMITNKMPLLSNLIKIVVNGFIVYRILLDIFQIVRNAKNPEEDRIEVLEL